MASSGTAPDRKTDEQQPLLPTSSGTGVVFAFCIVAFIWLYRDTFLSMWEIWGASDTYAHGYIVFPAVAWLIWRKRSEILAAPSGFSWMAAALLFLCGLGWAFASLLSVGVVAQFLCITMLLALIWAGLGTSRASVILFPLLFAYFAVPMGEGLVPILMEFTADFAVAAITATGIPIFREGMFFSIPAGDFEVAKACSGIRYLMASFTLGSLYAYLTLSSRWQQFAFAGLAIIVPIIANGFRAYMIVMIAHHTDMEHAVGADHLVYGWLFFGVVMFVLFYIGGRFSSANQPAHDVHSAAAMTNGNNDKKSTYSVRHSSSVALLILPLLYGLPHLLSHQVKASVAQTPPTLALPKSTAVFVGPTMVPEGPTIAEFKDFATQGSGLYTHPEHKVAVYLYGYIPFDKEAEMVNNTNQLIDSNNSNVYSRRVIEANTTAGMRSVVEVAFRKNNRDYLAWYWYQYNDAQSASRIKAKIQEGKSWLFGRFSLKEAIVVLLVEGRDDEARERARDFHNALGTALRDCLFDATSPGCEEVGLPVAPASSTSEVSQ